jgi:hypothetical protein
MKAKLIKTKSNYVLSIDEKLINLFNHAIDSKDYGWVVADNFGGELLKLSKENCDEIFGVVNIEKLAEYEYPTINLGVNITTDIHVICQEPFIKGFNKAMELNKDKVFSLEDTFSIVNHVLSKLVKFEGFEQKYLFPESIYQEVTWKAKQIQQPTEIDVDIENLIDCQALVSCDETKTTCRICTNTGTPKLDGNNCLILKPIK